MRSVVGLFSSVSGSYHGNIFCSHPLPAFCIAPLSITSYGPQLIAARPRAWLPLQGNISPLSSRPATAAPDDAIELAPVFINDAVDTAAPAPSARDPFSGAEWAGWECRFSAAGARMPVPEDYVPESLREWDVDVTFVCHGGMLVTIGVRHCTVQGPVQCVPCLRPAVHPQQPVEAQTATCVFFSDCLGYTGYCADCGVNHVLQVWGFETLTSEKRRHGGVGKDGERDSVLYRKRGRVYPEVGCALDNLSLEVNAQNSLLEGKGILLATFAPGSYLLAKKVDGSDTLHLEVGLVPSQQGAGGGADSETDNDGPVGEVIAEESRARVEFRLDKKSCKLTSPLTITRERKYRQDFDDGLLYKDGGLDSQSLGRLLGSKCFAEEEAAPTAEELSGEWRSSPGQWKLFTSDGTTDITCTTTTTSSTTSHRPISYWTTASTGDGGGDSGDLAMLPLLLNGGFTVRLGAWAGDYPDLWDSAAAIAATASTKMPIVGKNRRALAVEVGWLVRGGVGDGDGGDQKREGGATSIREVVTTVIDAETMAPLGIWRGNEMR